MTIRQSKSKANISWAKWNRRSEWAVMSHRLKKNRVKIDAHAKFLFFEKSHVVCSIETWWNILKNFDELCYFFTTIMTFEVQHIYEEKIDYWVNTHFEHLSQMHVLWKFQYDWLENKKVIESRTRSILTLFFLYTLKHCIISETGTHRAYNKLIQTRVSVGSFIEDVVKRRVWKEVCCFSKNSNCFIESKNVWRCHFAMSWTKVTSRSSLLTISCLARKLYGLISLFGKIIEINLWSPQKISLESNLKFCTQDCGKNLSYKNKTGLLTWDTAFSK